MRREGGGSPQTLPPQTNMEEGGRPDEEGLLLPGVRVDRFVIDGILGRGGVAAVYRVHHYQLGGVYALKVLHVSRPALVGRLLAEGRLQAVLNFPNLVRVHDCFDVGGAPALLMDLVEGPTLAQHLATGPLPLPEVLTLFRGIVAGVGFAHQHGVVHRDLKPGNVLLARGPEGFIPRVSDFGIARHLRDSLGGEDFTQTGMLLGTPAYMAPEQLRRSAMVDTRADLFALGVILYEMCMGVRPFGGEELVDLLGAISRVDYVRPGLRNPNLPPPVLAAIEGCLVRDPDQRLPSCAALLAVLDGQKFPAHVSFPPSPDLPVPTHVQQSPPTFTSRSISTTSLSLQLGNQTLTARWPVLLTLLVGLLVGVSGVGFYLSRVKSYAYTQQLVGEAWRRSTSRPGEAMALLAAASEEGSWALSPADGSRLKEQGGDGKTLPAGGEVLALGISPDGTRLAAGLKGGEVASWDRATGRELFRVVAGVGNTPGQVRYSVDGTRVLVVAGRGVNGPSTPLPARVFDAATGEVLFTLANGDTLGFFDVALEVDQVINVTVDGKVLVWSLMTGVPHRLLSYPELVAPACVGVSADGHWLLEANSAGSISLVDLVTPSLQVVAKGTPAGSQCSFAFFNHNLNFLYQSPTHLQVFDRSGQMLVSQPRANSWALADPQGRRVVASDGATHLGVWSLPDLNLLQEMETDMSVSAGLWSAGGGEIFVRDAQGQVETWDPGSGILLGRQRGHERAVMSMAVPRDEADATLITGSRDRTLRLWPSRTSTPPTLSFPRKQNEDTQWVVMDPPSRRLVRAFTRGSTEVRDVYSGVLLGEFEAPGRKVSGLGISPGGDEVAVALERGEIKVLRGQDLVELASAPVGLWMRWVEFSPDGKYLVAYSDHTAVMIMELVTHRFRVVNVPALPFRVAFGPGHLYLGCRGGELLDLDLNTDEVGSVPLFSGGGVSRMVAQGGGARLLLGSFSGEVALYDPLQKKVLRQWKAHEDAVMGIKLSPDETRLVTMSWDQTVAVWDLESGKRLQQFGPFNAQPTAMALDSGGTRMAVGQRGGRVLVYELKTGQELGSFLSTLDVLALWFDEGGSALLAFDANDHLFTWPLGEKSSSDPREIDLITNLRVCHGSTLVVPEVPFPPPGQVWASKEVCRAEGSR